MRFRPGEDVAPGDAPVSVPEPPPPVSAVSFTEAAEAGGTDLDVLMGYEVFLGRDPENSFVIADSKTSPVGAFLRGLMASGEFQSAVLDRLAGGRVLPHEARTLSPTPEQMDWLFRHLRLPPTVVAALRAAPDWRHFLAILVAVPGFPRPPDRGAEPGEGVAAQAAGDGFVLIHLEEPKPGLRLVPSMLISGSGWVIAPADIVAVSVHLDDMLLTHARYGLPRPDVARNFPHYRHVDHCGFSFSAELPAGAALHEASELAITVRTASGDVGRRSLRLEPPSEAASGEGRGGWPIRLAVEEAALDADGTLRLRGWALSRETVSSVQVWLNDRALGEARLRLPRPDIAQLHPGYPEAGFAGFALVLGRTDPSGPGVIRVQVTDAAGETRQAIVPVTQAARDGLPESRSVDAAEAAIRLEIDSPLLEGDAVLGVVRGSLTVAGWAAARHGIERVSVMLDGALLGHAHSGMRREDIQAAFPDYEGALLSGFGLVLQAGLLPEGEHCLEVVARAKGGGSRSRRFSVTVERSGLLPAGASRRARMKPAEAAFGLRMLERASWHPVFSVSIAIGDAEDAGARAALEATLASLHAQAYPHWTADLCPPEAAGGAWASGLARAAGDRVRVVPAAGAAEPPASGGFAMRLRAGDLLGCDALLSLAMASAEDRAAELIYADELRVDPVQGRLAPFLKPDWSPDLLLSMNYLGRAWCAGAGLAFRARLAEAHSDYAAALTLSEGAARIAHVPRVLFECAASDSPAQEAAALGAALARRGIAGEVLPGTVAGTWRIQRRLKVPGGTRSRPAAPGLVSIIMPSCGARGLVRQAIRTIRATTAPKRAGGRAVEIVLLDNVPAGETATRAWLRRHADRVIDMPGPFNWSRFNNEGARAASGEYLLFLNDDVEARVPGWLEALLEQAQRPEIGVVGARLLYPDGKVQHGGLYLAEGHARHAFRFADEASPGPFGLATVMREVIGVTGACLMMHRRVFEALGGFEEAHSVVNNDLDFCLRSWKAGWPVVVTPHATLVHHELASRVALEDVYDSARFAGAWRERLLLGDPFRNPNLDPKGDEYEPAQEPALLMHIGRRGPLPEGVRRILAVKLDHIGDFLTALPALRALRRGFPEARIDVLVPQASAELARLESAVDGVAVFDFFHVRSGEGRKKVEEAEFEALRARLAPARYDIAVDLRMQPETRAVLPYTGADLLAGFDFEDRFPFLDVALVWENDSRLVRKRAHISQRLEGLVSAVLEACGDTAPPPVADRLEARSVPALARLPSRFLDRPIACVHPGVGNPVRQWPAASFAGLIDLLVGLAGLHVVLVGAAIEAPVADEVMRLVAQDGAVESLVGRVGLAELPAVMQACVLFVGNNSGPQHLAASLGVPTVGVHSAVVDATEWGPLGAGALAIQRRMVCGPCYLEFASDCPRNLACLTGLRPSDVFAACRTLLAGTPGVAETRARQARPIGAKPLAKRRRRMVV